MTGKFFIATAVLVVTLFVGEMFPTLLRNTSIGISSMSSRLASALAPFLIFAGMFFFLERYEFLDKHPLQFYTFLVSSLLCFNLEVTLRSVKFPIN